MTRVPPPRPPAPRSRRCPPTSPAGRPRWPCRSTRWTRPIKLASNENPFDPLPSVRAAIDRRRRRPSPLPRPPGRRAARGAGRPARPHPRPRRGRLRLRRAAAAAPAVVRRPRRGGALRLAHLRGLPDLHGHRRRHAGHDARCASGPSTWPRITKAVTERTRLVLVTSPNNPTGTAVRHDELVALLEAVPERCLVVLDEAYHEYITGRHAPRALELLAQAPEPGRPAHVLQGLRAGRPARRLPARPPAGGEPRSTRRSSPSPSTAWARRRRWPRWSTTTSSGSGWTATIAERDRVPAGPARARLLDARRPGQLRVAPGGRSARRPSP